MIVEGTFSPTYAGDEFEIEIHNDFVVLKDWYYFTQFSPEHTIGLTLKDLDFVFEEEKLAKEWSIFE